MFFSHTESGGNPFKSTDIETFSHGLDDLQTVALVEPQKLR
jgi:hypothetical protein